MHSTLLLLQATQSWEHAQYPGVECRGHAQYPAFAPGSSKVAVGPFGLYTQNLLQLCTHAVIFSLIQFLCISLLEKSCVQRCRVPGPSLSQLWSVYQCQFCCQFRRIAWGCLEPRLGWIVAHFRAQCERTPCLIREVSAMLVAPSVFASPAAGFYSQSFY